VAIMVVGKSGYLGEGACALRLTNDLARSAIPASRPGPLGLTSAQREVLLLAAEGLTNAAIALRRNSSQHTVANLLAAAYAKLGIAGRRELRARLSLGG
jgi:DNA-binding CsgD family transcriptional regulator